MRIRPTLCLCPGEPTCHLAGESINLLASAQHASTRHTACTPPRAVLKDPSNSKHKEQHNGNGNTSRSVRRESQGPLQCRKPDPQGRTESLEGGGKPGAERRARSASSDHRDA